MGWLGWVGCGSNWHSFFLCVCVCVRGFLLLLTSFCFFLLRCSLLPLDLGLAGRCFLFPWLSLLASSCFFFSPSARQRKKNSLIGRCNKAAIVTSHKRLVGRNIAHAKATFATHHRRPLLNVAANRTTDAQLFLPVNKEPQSKTCQEFRSGEMH